MSDLTTEQLPVVGTKRLVPWYDDNDRIALVKRTIAKGATDDELALFQGVCQRTGLDPFARQIYMIERRFKNGNDWSRKMEIQTSIDGFRVIAERSQDYQGQTAPLWCGEDGVWKDVWLNSEAPSACKIGVHRREFKEPLVAVAVFDSYAQRKSDGSLTHMWAKMPDLMIAKCAEALALRKAFPQDLSGLYTSDEMGQASDMAEIKPELPATKPLPEGTYKKAKAVETPVSSQSGAKAAKSDKTAPTQSFRDMLKFKCEAKPFEFPLPVVVACAKKHHKSNADWFADLEEPIAKVMFEEWEQTVQDVKAEMAT